MKGLVLEVREKTVILMSPQGQFVERPIPRDPVRVGQTIQVDIESRRVHCSWKPAMVFAGVLMACVVSAAGYGYTQPFGVVNLDINPSFQMTYNAFEQTIAVKGLNADAKKVLQKQPLWGHRAVSDVVQELILASQESGYIHGGKKNMIYYAVSDRFWASREERILTALWNQATPAHTEITRILLRGSPEIYRRSVEKEESPIPELLSAVRQSPGQELLFKSDIPIEELGKPLEPALQPTTEINPSVPVVVPNSEQNAPTVNTPKKPTPLRKNTETPPKDPENLTEQPLNTQTDSPAGGEGNSSELATPTTPGEQGGPSTSPVDPGPASDSSTPSQVTTPSQNAPEDSGTGGGNENSGNGGGSESPGKGGPR